MIARIAMLALGLILTFLNLGTLKAVLSYYFFIGSQPLKLKLLKLSDSRIVRTILLAFGISFCIAAVLPETNSVWVVKIPDGAENALAFIGRAILKEETLFRLIPWLVLFGIRVVAKRSQWVEILNVLAAVSVSLAFGLAHLGNYIQPDIWVYLSTAIQTIAGLLYWRLLDSDGIAAPLIAHFAFDALIWLLITLVR